MRVFLILLLFTIGLNNYAQQKYINNDLYKLPEDQKYEALHGSVKIITEQIIYITGDTANKEFEFDKKGDCVRYVKKSVSEKKSYLYQFDEDGKLLDEKIYFNNKLIQQTKLENADNPLVLHYNVLTSVYEAELSKKKMIYDSAGLKTIELQNLNTSNQYTKTYKYDDGRLLSFNIVENDNEKALKLNRFFNYCYHRHNLLADSGSSYLEGVLQNKLIFERDSKGNIIKHINHQTINSDSSKFELYIWTFQNTLDSRGNWVKRIDIFNGEKVSTRKRTIKYW